MFIIYYYKVNITKMGRVEIKGYICERCSYIWKSRGKKEPVVCAKCKSPYWNTPRKNKIKKKRKR